MPTIRVSTTLLVLLVSSSLVTSDNCSGLPQCICNKKHTSINCNGKRLSSIPKFPVTAEKIYLQYNELTNIPSRVFLGLPNLKSLYLDFNKISNIEPFAFDGLRDLNYLGLRYNRLTSLGNNSLSNMPSLKELHVEINAIRTAANNAFNGTESLEYLDMHGNDLMSIPNLGSQPNLNVLMLARNRISDATFPSPYYNSSRMMEIVLSKNYIAELTNATFESLSGSSLTKLYLTRNDIRHVEPGTFSCFNSIDSLKLGSNPLNTYTLKTALAGLVGKDIRSLDLSSTELGGVLSKSTFSLMANTTLASLTITFTKLRVISNDAFSKLNHLSTLNLSNNAINEVRDRAFDGLVQLSTLKLSGNKLSSVPAILPTTLNVLYLDNNQIPTIENNSFIRQRSLQTLVLTSTRINILKPEAFNGLINLKKLTINDNNIISLPENIFSPLTRLQHLDLSRNSIFKIQQEETRSFSSLVALEYLNLAANECSYIPKDTFHAMRSLRHLHLESNNLGKILSADVDGEMLQELKKLEEVYIMNNNIEQLPESMFKSQYSLRFLMASNNKLSTWGPSMFRSTQKLSKLVLSNNPISNLQKYNLHDLNNLKYLDLTGSPFSCDCDLRWFRDWINATTVKLTNVGVYTCNSPKVWEGIRLLDFDRSKINCLFFTTSAIVGTAVGTLLLSLLLVWLIYKNRWRLRLRWYKLSKRGRRFLKRSKSLHNGTNYGTISDQTYNAYVSFSIPDREWALEYLLPGIDRGQLNNDHKFGGEFRLYYEDRDAEPGATQVANVVENMDKSRKVIVILSRNYFNGMNEFELDQAMFLLIEREIEDIIVVKLGDVSAKKVPKCLYRQMRTGMFLEWEDNELSRETFKEKLIDRLNRNPNQENS